MADDDRGSGSGGSSGSRETNDVLLWEVIGLLFALMVVGTYVGQIDSSVFGGNLGTNSGNGNNEETIFDEDGGYFDENGNYISGNSGGITYGRNRDDLDRVLNGNGSLAGDGSIYADVNNSSANTNTHRGGVLSNKAIEIGEKIVNKVNAKVRQTVGGQIIGEQAKREVGEVMEGPINSFGENWYRINYKDAPDGWVTEREITADIGAFRALNIFPIFFSIFKPLGMILAVIFAIIIGMIFVRQNKNKKIEVKKRELELENADKNVFSSDLVDDPDKHIKVSSGSTAIFQATQPTESNKESAPSNLPTGDLSITGLKFKSPGDEMDSGGVKNEKWTRVKKLLDSHNTSDWKQSVIEADIMLEEMLNKMGYDEGNSIGDKLKQIEQSDFITLNKAWEAHRVRNEIAHRGGDYVMSKSEAERVIKLYKKVFEEFYYI